MKVGSVLFVLSVLFFVGGLFFWGFHSCDRTPLDVLTVGRVKGSFLGSSSDLHDGFNWDLAQFLGLKLHKKIVFKELDGSHLISALKANEVDVVCSSLSITDERMKEVAMVHLFAAPYPFIQLLFWDSTYQNELGNVNHIRDVVEFFEKKPIGIAIHGSLWEKLLRSYGMKNFKVYEKETFLVSALRNGEVSSIVLGRISSDFLARQYPNIWTLTVALDKPYSYGVGVAINKERPELVKQIAGAIQDLKDEGMINLWQQKWFNKIY